MIPLEVIKNRAGINTLPSFCTYIVTWRCNCRCRMCDIWKKPKENLKDIKGIRLLWPRLKNGTVPYCLSMLIEEKRDELLIYLQRQRYQVEAWPTLPQYVIDNLNDYPEVALLGRKLFQINFSINHPVEYYEKLIEELKDKIKK